MKIGDIIDVVLIDKTEVKIKLIEMRISKTHYDPGDDWDYEIISTEAELDRIDRAIIRNEICDYLDRVAEIDLQMDDKR